MRFIWHPRAPSLGFGFTYIGGHFSAHFSFIVVSLAIGC